MAETEETVETEEPAAQVERLMPPTTVGHSVQKLAAELMELTEEKEVVAGEEPADVEDRPSVSFFSTALSPISLG